MAERAPTHHGPALALADELRMRPLVAHCHLGPGEPVPTNGHAAGSSGAPHGRDNDVRGLLPICAWCKKVRNDQNYWQGVDRYIEEHSDARFTHGICPDCRAQVSRDAARLPPT